MIAEMDMEESLCKQPHTVIFIREDKKRKGDAMIKAGLIGCGDISGAYLNTLQKLSSVRIAACADIRSSQATKCAEKYSLEAMTVEALLQSDDVQVVLNLTTPQAHAEINLRALEAGKHVYVEKPLALNLADGKRVLETAAARGLKVGGAPDTFLGGAHQTVRNLVDSGMIGRPLAGIAWMQCRGHENWHPNPAFYYAPGGGPMFDMGPYYLTALVNLLGPVKRVASITTRGLEERIATSEARKGERIPVDVSTHYSGTIEFESGAVVTMITSFDVWHTEGVRLDLFGTEGSLRAADPNCFGGSVYHLSPGKGTWEEQPLTHQRTDNLRGIGLADMMSSIVEKRAHRCSGELAFHVLEVMCAFDTSSSTGAHVDIISRCERPAPLDPVQDPY